jgi:hypothetical protein
MPQDVVGGEAEHEPARLPERVDASDVAAELRLPPMMVALVLQRDPPLWIGEVDPCEQAAAGVPYLVLRNGRRRARVVQQQSQPCLHRRLGARVDEREQLLKRAHTRPPRPFRGVLSELG